MSGERRAAARLRRRTVGGLGAGAVVAALGVAAAIWVQDGGGTVVAADRPASERAAPELPAGLRGADGSADGSANGSAADSASAPPDRSRSAEPSVSPEPRRSPAPTSSPAPTGSAGVPDAGAGTFAVAAPVGGMIGAAGPTHRYRVEVEDGSGVDPAAAAAEVAAVLGDGRGRTRAGAHTFRQVGAGQGDFVVRIATPATTDRLCGQYGLNTRGEVNCRAGESVVVNLKRWMLGSPRFPGPVTEYRALIVNHEVGHWLGHGHETCPGPGQPAPAMMQQIDGLRGCVANAWPYTSGGRYLGGPAVP